MILSSNSNLVKMFGLRMSVLFSLLLAVAGLQSSRALTAFRRCTATPALTRGHAGYGHRELLLTTGGRGGHTDAITQSITPGVAKPLYGHRELLTTGGRGGHTDAITQSITPGAAKPLYGHRELLTTGGRGGHTPHQLSMVAAVEEDAITESISSGAVKPPTPAQIAAIDYNPNVYPGAPSVSTPPRLRNDRGGHTPDQLSMVMAVEDAITQSITPGVAQPPPTAAQIAAIDWHPNVYPGAPSVSPSTKSLRGKGSSKMSSRKLSGNYTTRCESNFG